MGIWDGGGWTGRTANTTTPTATGGGGSVWGGGSSYGQPASWSNPNSGRGGVFGDNGLMNSPGQSTNTPQGNQNNPFGTGATDYSNTGGSNGWRGWGEQGGMGSGMGRTMYGQGATTTPPPTPAVTAPPSGGIADMFSGMNPASAGYDISNAGVMAASTPATTSAPAATSSNPMVNAYGTEWDPGTWSGAGDDMPFNADLGSPMMGGKGYRSGPPAPTGPTGGQMGGQMGPRGPMGGQMGEPRGRRGPAPAAPATTPASAPATTPAALSPWQQAIADRNAAAAAQRDANANSPYQQAYQGFNNQIQALQDEYGRTKPGNEALVADLVQRRSLLASSLDKYAGGNMLAWNPEMISANYRHTGYDIPTTPYDMTAFFGGGMFFPDTPRPGEVAADTTPAPNAATAAGTAPLATPSAVPNIMPTTDPYTEMYQNVLGRVPDAAGLEYWRGVFGDEISPEEYSAFEGYAAPELANNPAYAPAPTATALPVTGPVGMANGGIASLMPAFGRY